MRTVNLTREQIYGDGNCWNQTHFLDRYGDCEGCGFLNVCAFHGRKIDGKPLSPRSPVRSKISGTEWGGVRVETNQNKQEQGERSRKAMVVERSTTKTKTKGVYHSLSTGKRGRPTTWFTEKEIRKIVPDFDQVKGTLQAETRVNDKGITQFRVKIGK